MSSPVNNPIPEKYLYTKSIEQQSLEALQRLVEQLDAILAAGAQLWPALFKKEQPAPKEEPKHKKRK